MSLLDWTPTLQTLDAIMLFLAIGLPLIAGVPLLLATVRVPRSLGFHVVAEEELSEAQQNWFGEIETRLVSDGYRPAATLHSTSLPTRNLMRVYATSGDPALVSAMALADGELAAVNVEFTTVFADGGLLTTRNATEPDYFRPPQDCTVNTWTTVRDPLKLRARHLDERRPLLHRGPEHVPQEKLVDVMESYHQRWIAHQVESGALRILDEKQCAPTPRLALKAVFEFLSPLGGPQIWLQLLGLLLSAATVPSLLFATEPYAAALGAELGLSANSALVLSMAPTLIGGGALLGLSLGGKAVYWGLGLGYALSRGFLPHDLDPAATGLWLLLLIASGAVSDQVYAWKLRRVRLV